MAEQRFTIAHVSPFPWEAEENGVNAYVRRLTHELSRRGHRVLVLAPSRSSERVRASRRELSSARTDPDALLSGTDGGQPRVLCIGEAIDVPGGGHTRMRPPTALPVDVARTTEQALSSLPLDFVHVHEPFAPSASNAALRHSRSLNVATFHHPTERLLSTLLARRFVETFFGRLDARSAARRETAALMERYFPGRYTLLGGAAGGGPAGGGARSGERDDVRNGVSGGAESRPGERPGEHDDVRNGVSGDAPPEDWGAIVDDVEAIYEEVAARRHPAGGDAATRARLSSRPLIDVDLHMHTDHSGDCATPVDVLLATAKERGLGAIAVTDHNEISGALEAREKASRYGVKVIVGEEVKTGSEGEVIGLFIEELIPRGLTLAETIAEIRRQGGVVYVPHPFDRMHAVPDYEHLLPRLGEIDAIEVFNPRVAIGAFNEEAARFAEKYRVIAAAGSDSHVAQGLGSVRNRMRDFDGPEEFLQSLRDAEIVTKPTSLLYVQALKFLQTKATPRSARQARKARRVRRASRPRRRS